MVGVERDELIVLTERGDRQIDPRDISAMRVKSHSYWYVGTAVGASLDIALAVILIAAEQYRGIQITNAYSAH